MKTLVVLLGVLSLVGCARAKPADVGFTYWLRTNPNGQEFLAREGTGCGSYADKQNDACWNAAVKAVVTNNSSDKEFWIFGVFLSRRIYVGVFMVPIVPVSPNIRDKMPTDVAIIGAKEACEAVRARVPADNPTEPCRGPFYFHVAKSGS
jgi:hypothetical protein